MTYLFCHVIPVLGRVHTGLKRGSPRCRVHSGTRVLRARKRLPVDEEGDRILRLGHAIERLACRDASRGTGGNSRWDGTTLHHPAVDVDVVRRKVVAIQKKLTRGNDWVREGVTHLISESLPAHARKVSNWLFGWLIQAVKKLNSPRLAAFALASLYTGSNLARKMSFEVDIQAQFITDRLWCSTKQTTPFFSAAATSSLWCLSSCTAGLVTRTWRPRSIA